MISIGQTESNIPLNNNLTLDKLTRTRGSLTLGLELDLLADNLPDILPASTVLDDGDSTGLLLQTNELLRLHGVETEALLLAGSSSGRQRRRAVTLCDRRL